MTNSVSFLLDTLETDDGCEQSLSGANCVEVGPLAEQSMATTCLTSVIPGPIRSNASNTVRCGNVPDLMLTNFENPNSHSVDDTGDSEPETQDSTLVLDGPKLLKRRGCDLSIPGCSREDWGIVPQVSKDLLEATAESKRRRVGPGKNRNACIRCQAQQIKVRFP
jgi:hypothetical protein